MAQGAAQDERSVPQSAQQTALFPEDGVTPPRILIINTRSSLYEGPTHPGLSDYELFERELCEIDDLKKPGMPEFHVKHLKMLDLSADQGHQTWTAIAEMIEAEYNAYTGFVVQHGTDTMVYSATALSFMLENLGKPVMFTGSLIPANLVQSDMKRNIILAMLFAQNKEICEVCIVFAERLFRANRCLKASRHNLQPFVTPNMQPLAILRGNRVILATRLLVPAPRGRLRVYKDMSSVILTLKLVPGMSADMAIQLVATTRARAIVLCAFGTGNVPVRRDVVLRMTQHAMRRGLLVVVCSQNRFGSVDLASYDTGRQLMEVGAVGAADMTVEAAIVKLKYLFGRSTDVDTVRKLFLHSIRGEVSKQKYSHL